MTSRIHIKGGIESITPLWALTLLAVFSFIFNDFDLSVMLGYSAFGFLVILFVLMRGGRIRLSLTQIAALTVAVYATVMVFLPVSMTSVTTISIVLALDVAMGMIVLAEPDEEDVRRCLKILLIAGVLMSLYGIAVNAFPDLYYNGVKNILSEESQRSIEMGFSLKYGVAVGGEVIVVDYYAVWGLIIALNALLIYGRDLKKRWLYVLIFGICTVALIMQNRKAELLMAVAVVGFLLVSNMNITGLREKKRQILILLFVIMVCAAGGLVLLRMGYLSRYVTFFTQMNQKVSGGNSQVEVSSGRFKLWGRAWNLFCENPIFGIGWGNFRLHLTDTYNPFNDGQLSNAHNNYLQMLCETGIVGFLLFVGPLFFILYRTLIKIYQLRDHRAEQRLARIAATASLSFQIFYLGISFMDPVWYKMFTWPFYGVSVILLLYAERADQEQERFPAIRKK